MLANPNSNKSEISETSNLWREVPSLQEVAPCFSLFSEQVLSMNAVHEVALCFSLFCKQVLSVSVVSSLGQLA